MTFLPIVDRELRVASRRRGTYWSRAWIALAAMALGTWFFGLSTGFTPQQVAQYIFRGISVMALAYSLLAGRRFTADALSSEKREGTLGLLFLTDLRGYDVVFGKLVATSLRGFYGLLAVLPVLAIPLMMGGVAREEVWRVALVLVNTFLFSLAVGIFVSAFTRDARQAYGANFGLLLAITTVPVGCWGVWCLTRSLKGLGGGPSEFLYSCPAYSLWLCFDLRYAVEAKHFWWSLGVVHGFTWLLIVVTCWIIPYCWQERPSGTLKRRWWEWWAGWSYGKGGSRKAFRKRLLDVNAFYWLAARVRLKPALVWAFLGFMVIWWIYVSIKSGSFLMFEGIIATALILNLTFKLWVAVETAQRLGEDQSMGALELLLSTRLTVRDILRGQLLALRRQFLWPLVVIIAVELVFTGAAMHRFRGEGDRMFLTWMAGILMLLADLVTLVWVAISSALISKNPNQAIIRTISRVLILPWVLFGVVAVSGNVVASVLRTVHLDWRFYLGLWFWLGVLVDAGFGVIAWLTVRTRFRDLAQTAVGSSDSGKARDTRERIVR